MTRRRVVFKDKNGMLFSTPEFNGDKTEYEYRGMNGRGDWCSVKWEDATCIFEGIKTKAQFESASSELQGCYHSFLGDSPAEPVLKIESIESLNCDKIYLIENGNLRMLKPKE